MHIRGMYVKSFIPMSEGFDDVYESAYASFGVELVQHFDTFMIGFTCVKASMAIRNCKISFRKQRSRTDILIFLCRILEELITFDHLHKMEWVICKGLGDSVLIHNTQRGLLNVSSDGCS